MQDAQKAEEQRLVRQTLAGISAHLIDSGLSVSEIANIADVPYRPLWRLLRRMGVYQPQRECNRIPPERERLIIRMLLNTRLTRRQIAERVKVSKGSVDNRAKKLRRQAADSVSSEVVFREQKHRCPEHGVVAYTPCPACAARNAIDAKT